MRHLLTALTIALAVAFGRFDQMPGHWRPAPTLTRRRGRGGGREGTGDPGPGSGRGGENEDRDRQDVARETRERETGSIYGGGGERGSRTSGHKPSRQAQLDRMMRAQHRNRNVRGAIDTTTGLSALSGMERAYEAGTQEIKQDRREMAIGAVAAVIGAMFGIPGAGGIGKTAASRGRQGRIDAAMESYDETGVLSDRGYGTGSYEAAEGGEPLANQQQTQPTTPTDPTTPATPLPDPYDEFWNQNFGVDPNDPRLTDPTYNPFGPPTTPAARAQRRLDLQGPQGNPTLAYMSRVTADIQRSRERSRLAGPM